MNAVSEAHGVLAVRAACSALGLPRATWYRARTPAVDANRRARKVSPRALRVDERALVLEQLNSPRFADFAVPQVHATLLDEGSYLCSPRTMYRILAAADEVRERRDQLRHPAYTKPELLASVPNQVWSWDITRLKGPAKWNHFQLYVIIDIYSRYVVGWMLADRESTALAMQLIEETVGKQCVVDGTLTIHADRGSSMTSKEVALLLADLGVTKTHSRPHVSNDNPYSEAHFKTLKYRPQFPECFGSIEDARAFCREFFEWYNCRHRHSGIEMMTPHDVHHGLVDAIVTRRSAVLALAHERHPERFVKGSPASPRRPGPAWINPPTTAAPLAAAAH